MFLKYSLEKNKIGGASPSINIPFPASIPAPTCSSEAQSKTINTKIYFIKASKLERLLDEYSNVISINSNYQIEENEILDKRSQKGHLYLLHGDNIKNTIKKLTESYFTPSISIYSMTIPCNIPKSQIEKFQEKIIVLDHNAPSLNKLYNILITNNYNTNDDTACLRKLLYNYKKVDIFALGLVFYEIICKNNNFRMIIDTIAENSDYISKSIYKFVPHIEKIYKGITDQHLNNSKIQEILSNTSDIPEDSPINTISIIELLFILTSRMIEYDINDRVNIEVVNKYLVYLKNLNNTSLSIAPNAATPSIDTIYSAIKRESDYNMKNICPSKSTHIPTKLITICLVSHKPKKSCTYTKYTFDLRIQINEEIIINALTQGKKNSHKKKMCGSFNCIILFENYVLRIGNKRIDNELKSSKQQSELNHVNIGAVYDYGKGYIQEYSNENLTEENINEVITKYKFKNLENLKIEDKIKKVEVGLHFQYSIMPKYQVLDPINLQIKTLPELINFLLQIANGVKYLHNADIIHCDIKLKNIMVDKNLRPVIIDFGLISVPDIDDANKTNISNCSINDFSHHIKGSYRYYLVKDYSILSGKEYIEYETFKDGIPLLQDQNVMNTKNFFSKIFQNTNNLYNKLLENSSTESTQIIQNSTVSPNT